jgi:hypothetical protein
LAKVNGQYRNSVIVYPKNDVLPYNDVGNRTAAHGYLQNAGYHQSE